MRTAASLLLVLAAGASPLVAGQARDRVAPVMSAIKPGTAIVSGRVILGPDSETPVRRAIVSLESGDGSGRRSVVTDQDGRFAFRALSAGRYTLAAEKAAHLTNNYGARRPGRPGTPLVIAEGQKVVDLRLPLPRGAVIAGTLMTATGEPMPNTPVTAIPIAEATAGGRSATTEFASDDRGAYRIFGLAAGEYLVAAFPSIGSGAIEVRTEAEYDAAVRELSRRSTSGAPSGPAPSPPAPARPQQGFAPTYFPGTPVSAQAVPIKVAVGEAREGLDIPITMFRMSTISGTVFGTDGQPARAVQIQADPVGPPVPISGGPVVRGGRPDSLGRFSIPNLPPGTYHVTARGGGVVLREDGSLQSLNGDAQTDWAVADVQVVGDDISGLTLSLQPGLTFSGRFTSGGSQTAPKSWQSARVTIQPVNPGTGNPVANAVVVSAMAPRAASPAADGSFAVTGIQPGRYEIGLRLPTGMSSAWSVQSIVMGGRDLRDAPLTFEQGSLKDVTITVTNQPAIVTGTLSSASGTPAADYYVVLFPADRTLWHSTSPRVKVTQPAVDGTFTIRELPAGEYRIAALTDVEDNEWRSSTFLDSLLATSISVTVRDGATTRQDVRIR